MDDLISRQAAINIVDSETVSTNPEHFKSSEKFIKFMDDADIASFGKWQWANGFNTALVATKVQLKKLPSAQPEGIYYVKFSEEDYEKIAEQLRKIPIVLTLSEPEIIRCGECLMHGVCRFEIGLGENGFCSQGKRGDKDE